MESKGTPFQYKIIGLYSIEWIFTLLILHIEIFLQIICSVGISFPHPEDCLRVCDIKNISRRIFSPVSSGNKA